ncbi:MAG: hypothetical protein ABL997_16730 [Planctomycetota bacterium]
MNKLVKPTVAGKTAPAAPTVRREPRAFAFLKPRRITTTAPEIDLGGKAMLAARVNDCIPALARALVDHSIAVHNERGRENGTRQPIQLSVLNRRRRAARAWVQAVLSADVDAPTLHAVATQWLPMLAGHGREADVVARTIRQSVEFLRGAITGVLFDEPEDNLLLHARALHVLETVLGVHLAAAEEALR